MGKKNKKKKIEMKKSSEDLVFVSKEEYNKYLLFTRLKDQIPNLVSEIEQAWGDHCCHLVQELQIDLPIIGNSVDDAIGKLLDFAREIKYYSTKSVKKNKKKWYAPLCGGTVRNSYSSTSANKVVDLNQTAKESAKKPRKSEVELKHTETQNGKPPLRFSTFIIYKIKTVENPIQDSDVCQHGVVRPCEICDGAKYSCCD